jgi:glycosyltransferase involved in cell wall biosynthesis
MISFNNSVFNNKEEIEIPLSCEVIFVSDLFSSDYCGGAEMTTDALIDASQFNVFRLHSKDVNLRLLEQGFNKFWIFGNFSQMNLELIPTIVSNIKYDIVEYDYKYCRYRSPEKHMTQESIPCNCHNDIHGKMISTFFYGAKTLWWMSEDQRDRYHNVFPFLSERNNTVLSSVFDEKFFAALKMLREKNKNAKRNGWIVLGSQSWIKGADLAENWCKKNNKKYEIIWNEDYGTVLDKLSKAEGFVYLPKGGDTCPRMVIEAKLLGCKLKINKNVQHAHEIWFDTDDMLEIESYLYAARNRFWNGVKYSMSYHPTISGYTTTRNCISQNYPFIESITSLLGFCDEVVVIDGGSDDGTWESLVELSNKNSNLIIHKHERDWRHNRYAVFDGLQKALARSLCTSKFCWQQDVDEIVHEDDYLKIKNLVKNFPKGVELIALPVIEYWGCSEKVRMDINPWKWRLSRNLPHITHGIPASLRRFDENGDMFSAQGSDGCDYIRSDNFSPIQFVTFYNSDIEEIRRDATINQTSLRSFEDWFNRVISELPGVHHYSWFDISRKIKTYKTYWSRHWQSLYNIDQDDTAENNMFFGRPWSEVTDKDISSLSDRLKDEMGGWIFHKKIDFSSPTPHLKISIDHPKIIHEWINK